MKAKTTLFEEHAVENPEGIYRTTLTYNDDVMLCHFSLCKDAEIPIHNHPAVQIGYVMKGKIQFMTEKDTFIAEKGTSYLFQAFEKHGAKVLEGAEAVECFAPTREEYK